MIAQLALILWVPISMMFFAKLRPVSAATLTILGGTMWLPVGDSFSLPGPDLDRERLACLIALVLCIQFAPKRLFTLDATRIGYLMLPALLAGTALISGLTNREPLGFGPRLLPGMSLTDTVGFMALPLLGQGIPFALGLLLVRTREDILRILSIIVISGLIYSLLVLVELRLSPILHLMIYGHHPRGEGDFMLVLRGGGYRPVVFTLYPLDLALLLFTCALSAIGLWRLGFRRFGPVPSTPAAGWLAVIIIFCKCLAPILYGVVAFPLTAFLSSKNMMRVAAATVLIAFAYPTLRNMDLVPTKQIVEWAAKLNPERAESVAIRFANEQKILDRAQQRFMFGWAGYGRWRNYDEVGNFADTIDGLWLIQLGTTGVVGLTFYLAMLVLPVVVCWRSWRRIKNPGERILVAVLSLIIAITAMDSLPNASADSFTMFLAGALASAARVFSTQRSEARTAQPSGANLRSIPIERVALPRPA